MSNHQPVPRKATRPQFPPIQIVVFGLAAVLAMIGCHGQFPPADETLTVATSTTTLSEARPWPGSEKPLSLDGFKAFTGTSSCSSRGCHGRLAESHEELPPSRTSYSRWLLSDPHANAYETLNSPQAKKIGKNLQMDDVSKEPRCIACHAGPQALADSPQGLEERLFGVGCESCHGAATKWLEPHKSTTWASHSQPEKEAMQTKLGMNPLTNLKARARVCAACHVGAPAPPENPFLLRDVDHELIAAGHPRLTFEFGAYLANEPKHWVEKNRSPDFEARVWAIGQLASAESALELLIDRAESQRNWPEFAENDCFACHHDLGRPAIGPQIAAPGFGRLRLNRWNYSLVSLVTGKPFPLETLDKTLEKGAPQGQETAALAKRLLASLREAGDAAEKQGYSSEALARLRVQLATRGAQANDLGWDEMEPIALGIKAIVASERSFPGAATGPLARIDTATDVLLKKLAIPANASTSLFFRRPPAFEKELLELFESLR